MVLLWCTEKWSKYTTYLVILEKYFDTGIYKNQNSTNGAHLKIIWPKPAHKWIKEVCYIISGTEIIFQMNKQIWQTDLKHTTSTCIIVTYNTETYSKILHVWSQGKFIEENIKDNRTITLIWHAKDLFQNDWLCMHINK